MSPLSKVFVVLTTLLAIVLVTLIVPFVAKVEDAETKMSDLRSLKQAAEAQARSAQQNISMLQQRQAEQIAGYEAGVAELEGQVADLTAQVARLQGDLTTARTDLAKRDADFSRLTAAMQQQGELLETYLADLNRSEQQLVDRQVELVETRDANDALSSEVNALTRRVQFLQENLVASEEQYADLAAKWELVPDQYRQDAGGDQVASRPIPAPEGVEGSVVDVEALTDELTFIQTNIGTRDGVRENMEFIVHRGDQYVASVVLTLLDVDNSAAQIIRQGDAGPVMPGDRLTAASAN